MVSELSDKERIAILETERTQMKTDLDAINKKLDDLLDLKSKGMGALWLVGLIIGVAGMGIGTYLINMFRPHL